MQRLWGLRSPQRTSSRQLSIGTPGSNVLDTGLLHQLRALCALRPSALLALARNGALKDLQIQVLHFPIRPQEGLLILVNNSTGHDA